MSKFFSYIHNLRGVAILFVVGVHARGNALDWESNPVSHNLIATFFDSHEGNGTVMFLFIAGFLFQHIQQHRFNFKKYIQQKFKYVILPYIFFSIPIIIFRIMTDYRPFSAPESFTAEPWTYQFIYHFITGTHMAPFWFISAIIMFYLTAPVFHAIDKPAFYKYIFPVIFIVGIFTFRSAHNGNPLLSYLHYLPVYFAGMWASHYKERIFSMDLRYFWILTGVYVVITFFEMRGAFAVARDMTFEQVIFDGELVVNIYLIRAVLVCFIFAMLFYYFQFKAMPVFELLANYSFGIYFVHFLVLIASRKLIESVLHVDFSVITFTLFFAANMGISVLAVYVIKRFTGSYSRSLIGS